MNIIDAAWRGYLSQFPEFVRDLEPDLERCMKHAFCSGFASMRGAMDLADQLPPEARAAFLASLESAAAEIREQFAKEQA